MKKGFTIIEVTILFVIFLIVAFLVAPLSLDDTAQAKFTSKWRNVQSEFLNIFYTYKIDDVNIIENIQNKIDDAIVSQIVRDIPFYKITYKNGANASLEYTFDNYKQTYSGATLAYKILKSPKNEIIAIFLYDVNGSKGPNIWGKDVYGYNLFADRIEPMGKHLSIEEQKFDCSKNGTGLYCSNYYLIGGSFD